LYSGENHQRQLVLYGTVGCHLCELAEQQLQSWVERGWQVELVDIADDETIYERFSLLIPILENLSSGDLLNWPFDQALLCDFLTADEKG
jgi:hypothetical protein